MKSNRLEGKVTSINDSYAIVEFAKGSISFGDGGELYTNMHSLSVKVGSDSKIYDVAKRQDMIVRYGNNRNTELHKYMLATLLLWDSKALQKHIYELVGLK